MYISQNQFVSLLCYITIITYNIRNEQQLKALYSYRKIDMNISLYLKTLLKNLLKCYNIHIIIIRDET